MYKMIFFWTNLKTSILTQYSIYFFAYTVVAVSRFEQQLQWPGPWAVIAVAVLGDWSAVNCWCFCWAVKLYEIMNRYSMFGRGICEKSRSRDNKISWADQHGKFSHKTGIFHKYSSQTWYVCLFTQNIIQLLNK
jgi:hypothetical protein